LRANDLGFRAESYAGVSLGARISMLARSDLLQLGPDTEAQDQSLPLCRFSLQRTAGPYSRVILD